jgi:dTMP kinase
MNSNRREDVELTIWKEIASENLSVSHDRWHIDRVLSFAHQLHRIYGGDLEVITAAVILHDLGRRDPEIHGQDSIEKSVDRARDVLHRVHFAPGKVERVISAISEHDNPDIRPSTIEGRILKDADFLGGFGAWGILRICMWAAETKGGVSQAIDRLENRMPERLANLEFIESQLLGEKEIVFPRLFLSLLNQPAKLPTRRRKGKYIVLEGISGSGKDTQADLLQERLNERGHITVRVSEPADVYRELRDTWRAKHNRQLDDPMIMKFLLMADRYELMQRKVWPALEKGHIVLSVRSFLSTLVYQCDGVCDVDATAFSHRFVPLPDLLLLFDVDTSIAWNRIKDRPNRGIYEKRDLLKQHREAYRHICHWFFEPRLEIVDASKGIDAIARKIWKTVELLVGDMPA